MNNFLIHILNRATGIGWSIIMDGWPWIWPLEKFKLAIEVNVTLTFICL